MIFRSLKSVHAAKDLTKIEAATEALNTAWQAASQEMYAAMNQQGGGGGAQEGPEGSQNGSNDKEVTDVDFEEVKK